MVDEALPVDDHSTGIEKDPIEGVAFMFQAQ